MNERFAYYCMSRPPDYGAVPAGSVAREFWLPARVAEALTGTDQEERVFPGIVAHAGPLSAEDIDRYELVPGSPVEFEAWRVRLWPEEYDI